MSSERDQMIDMLKIAGTYLHEIGTSLMCDGKGGKLTPHPVAVQAEAFSKKIDALLAKAEGK